MKESFEENFEETFNFGCVKENLLNELFNSEVPDFSLFQSDESIDIMPELLSELLDEDKKWFQSVLAKKNEELQFDDIICNGKFSYLRNILHLIVGSQNNLKIRNIVQNFMGIFQDFTNYIDYSTDFYDKLVWMKENLELDAEQKRLLDKNIKAYEERGIDLPIETQEKIKELNKKIVDIGEKYKNNLVDEQSEFSYYISDDSSVQGLPESLLEKAKSAAGDKGGYLFDATPSCLIDLVKYSPDPKIRKEIADIRESWATNGKYDNRENVLSLLKLNDEKAKLMGYKNAGEMFLVDTMARDPDLFPLR